MLLNTDMLTFHDLIYIAQNSTNTIRKITKGGIITTVAGNGKRGTPQDGQSALTQPLGLSPDITSIAMAARDGVLYFVNIGFTDNGVQNFIFQLDKIGLLHKIVGGNGGQGLCPDGDLAKDTCFASCLGIVIHPITGELFFTDTLNQIVRKIAVSSGRIVTVAGTPQQGGYQGDGGPAIAASFFFPAGIATDSDGSLYIADGLNRIVRKVVPVKSKPGNWDYANGIISTIAGASPVQNNLSEEGGPATQVPMGFPVDVALDGAGNLFILQSLLNFDNDGTRENVVWRVNLDVDVMPASSLSLNNLLPDLLLDFPGSEARDVFLGVTARLIDVYGRGGEKISGHSRSLGKPGSGPDEEVSFDLRSEVEDLSTQGITPTKIRVEARSKTGQWITRDVSIP